jgi:hypothetical protein
MAMNIKGAALGAGTLWGLAVFFVGIFAAATGSYGVQFVNALGSIYLGYAPTYPGAIIGGILGFIDGAIAAAIFAYLYNHFSK